MNNVQGLSEAFGTVIFEIRKQQGISQEQLAEILDSNNVYISLLEKGKRKPSLNAVILIAKALNISPEQLVKRTCFLLNC